jgi:hypothetical protein
MGDIEKNVSFNIYSFFFSFHNQFFLPRQHFSLFSKLSSPSLLVLRLFDDALPTALIIRERVSKEVTNGYKT